MPNPTPDDDGSHATTGTNGAAVPALAWLSVGDAAALLGVSARAVQKRAERGTLPARRVKHGRALRWEIDGRELDGSGSQDVRKMGAKRSQDGREPNAQNANFERETVRKMDARRSQDGRERFASPDALTARLLAQLETENAFLRATVEQLQRDGAEVRAALRESLKQRAPQLTAGDAPTAPTEAPQRDEKHATAKDTGDGANGLQRPTGAPEETDWSSVYSNLADELEKGENR
jgi:hypothetical protein